MAWSVSVKVLSVQHNVCALEIHLFQSVTKAGDTVTILLNSCFSHLKLFYI